MARGGYGTRLTRPSAVLVTYAREHDGGSGRRRRHSGGATRRGLAVSRRPNASALLATSVSRPCFHWCKLVEPVKIHLSGDHRTIAWYEDEGGVAHGQRYYDSLDAGTRAKFAAPMSYVANQPFYRNDTKFRSEGQDIWAFKVFKHRLMAFWVGRFLVITHGFTKKSDRVPPGELDRAVRLRDEYFSRKDRT